MESLPKFKTPPVVELVLGVQFQQVHDLSAIVIGEWWQTALKSRYPILQEQDHLPPVIEPLDFKKPYEYRMRISDRAPASRWWFLNTNQTELIQIQDDRLVFNWRKHNTQTSYPHYEAVRKSFLEAFVSLQEFLSTRKINLVPNMCELTYVNHIAPNEVWSSAADLHKVVTFYSEAQSQKFLPELEAISGTTSYLMREGGKAEGRVKIHAQLMPPVGQQPPQLSMHVSSLGPPAVPTVEGVMAFLDKGHAWGVKGFASVTSKEMHSSWGEI